MLRAPRSPAAACCDKKTRCNTITTTLPLAYTHTHTKKNRMAKFDERDPRWLVEKRADGTNVNAWHWAEKDATAWSKRRLDELFAGAVLVDKPRVEATGVTALSGEAVLNNRKARVVASYELKVTIGWRGAAAGGGEAAGTVELPVRCARCGVVVMALRPVVCLACLLRGVRSVLQRRVPTG